MKLIWLAAVASTMLLVSGADASLAQIVGPPCCKTYGSGIVEEISRRPREPLEDTASWLSKRLEGADHSELVSLEGALAGYCLKGCDEKFAVATTVVERALEARSADEERRERSVDRWASLFSGLGGAVLGAAATAWFMAREVKRSRKKGKAI